MTKTSRSMKYADLTPAEVYDLSQIAPPRFHATLHTPDGFAELVRLLRSWWADAERRFAEHGRARFKQDLDALAEQLAESMAAAEAAGERFREHDRVRGTAMLEAMRRKGVKRMSLSDFVAEGDYERHLQREHERLRDHQNAVTKHAHTLRCQHGVNWAVLNRFDRHGDTEAPRYLRAVGVPQSRRAPTAAQAARAMECLKALEGRRASDNWSDYGRWLDEEVDSIVGASAVKAARRALEALGEAPEPADFVEALKRHEKELARLIALD